MSQPSYTQYQRVLTVPENGNRHPSSPNESVKVDPMTAPKVENELAYGSKRTKRTGIPQSSKDKWMLAATIIGGWLVAVAFAGGHYHYGVVTDGQSIPVNITQSQTFAMGGQDAIKAITNALSRGVVVALGISSAAILTQMSWRIPATTPVTLNQLDQIFQLPSWPATAMLMASSLFRKILPIAILAGCAWLLEVVGVMAPQSLKVAPIGTFNEQTDAISLVFTQGPMTAANIFGGAYSSPSSSWIRTVQKAMMTPAPVSIPSPPNCGTGCSYNIAYKAPALQCTDLPASELTPHTATGSQTLYSGSSSLWPAPSGTATDPDVLVPYFTSNTSDHTTPYTLRIEWSGLAFDSSSPSSATPDAPLGVECTFVEADYTAFLWFNGTIQAFNPQIVTMGQTLVGQLANTQNCSVTPDASQPCWVGGINLRATAEAFSRLILGTIIYNPAGSLQVTSGTPDLLPLFDTNTTLVGQTASFTFNRTVPDMSSALQDMLCNVTVALIGAREDMVSANVTYESGGICWQFDDWVLEDIYVPTLAVFGLFAIYGLWCIWKGGAVDNSFSSFLVATRGESIDQAVTAAGNRDDIKKLSVMYTERGEFEVQPPDNKTEA